MVTAVRENGEFAVTFTEGKPLLWRPEGEQLGALVSSVPDDSIWFMGRTAEGFPLLVVVLPDDLNGAGSLFSLLPEEVRWLDLIAFAAELEDYSASLLVTQASSACLASLHKVLPELWKPPDPRFGWLERAL